MPRPSRPMQSSPSGRERETEQEQGPPLPSSSPDQRNFEEETLAYLAYILKETELSRARLDRMHRDSIVTNMLLAIAILVLIIVWLDITGVLPLF